MWSLPTFAGTVLGCFLFALLLSFIPGLRSQTTGRLFLINIISWVILALGDNAGRATTRARDAYNAEAGTHTSQNHLLTFLVTADIRRNQ
jgi:hypothetical protein